MINEHGLIGKSQSMGETKEGGTDDHYRRVRRAKRSGTRSTKRRRASRTKAVVKEEASPGEAKRAETKSTVAEVMMRPKELLVVGVPVMAEAVVVEMGAANPQVRAVWMNPSLEATKMARSSREMAPSAVAKVTHSSMQATGMASHAKSSSALRLGLCGKEHGER